MSKSSMLGFVGVLGLVAGVIIGKVFLGGDGVPVDKQAAATREAERAQVESELVQLRDENQTLTTKHDEVVAENERLERSVPSLQERLEAPTEPEADSPDGATLGEEGAPALAVAFGEYADLEVLLGADWPAMAEALSGMRPDLLALLETIDKGEQPDMEALIRIQKANQKLQEFALEAIGKLPTHSTGNGEFTHPIATMNLMAQVLESSEAPLTEQQRGSLAGFGDDYEGEWELVNARYRDDTPKLQKILDEATLKRDFMGRVEGVLSQDQIDAVFTPEIRNLSRLDPWSPAIMLMGHASPVTVSSEEDLRGKLMKHAAASLGVETEDLAAHSQVFDEWVEGVRDMLQSVPAPRVGFPPLDESITAGRAQLRALDALSSRLNLSEEARERLLSSSAFMVPRMVSSDQ